MQHVLLQVSQTVRLSKTTEAEQPEIYFVLSHLRLQKEKEDAYADIDRGREKYEKLQVSSTMI